MRWVTIKGKRYGLPGTDDPCGFNLCDSTANLDQRRKLVLSYEKADLPSVLLQSIARVKTCGLSFSRTQPGKAKRAAGQSLSKSCGQRICPDCEQTRRLNYERSITDRLERTPTAHLGMLTIKMPGAPSAWPLQRGLHYSLLAEKVAYGLLQRTSALLESHDGPFRLGAWRIHCRWSINEHSWDVHRHLIVAGLCLDSDVNAIRLKWSRLTGRDDPESVHYERLVSRAGSIRYLSTELASVLSKSEHPMRLSDQLDDAWSMAFNHPDATAEYLWTLRQRPGDAIGGFGTPANSNSRIPTSPPRTPRLCPIAS